MDTTINVEPKEIVWLPKSLADKIKGLQDGKVMEAEILSYYEESKRNIRIDIESIDDDVLQYKAHMSKARKAFREAKEEQLTATYELWEKFEEDMKGLRDYVSKAKGVIEPLANEIRSLKSLVGEMKSWEVDNFLSTVQKISVIYDNGGNDLMKFILENYKK